MKRCPLRALVTRPDALSPHAYRRFVQTAQIRALFPDGLVAGEPYLALNAIVLEASDLELLRRLTAIFSQALFKSGRELARHTPALIELGFPWVAAELLTAETPRVPIIGRFDFVQDIRGHWWMLEFNADTPSGLREAMVADKLVWAAIGRRAGLLRPNRGLRRAASAAFQRVLQGLPPGARVGLVTTAAELEDLAQMAFTRQLLEETLGRRGISFTLGDIDNLRGTRSGLELLGHPLDALYRYIPFEGLLGTPGFTAIAEAAVRPAPATPEGLRSPSTFRSRPGLVLNGLFGLLLQNKGLLAWLWNHRDDQMFTGEEQAAISAHLPPTWMIAESPESFEPTVVKQVFGREGEEVYFSEDLSREQLAELRRRRFYVVQRQIDVSELVAALPTALEQQGREVKASVGCFAVDGRLAGFYSRVGGKVITSRAKWVATFVENGE